MARLDCSDLNRSKLPRVISNRDGVFQAVPLRTAQPKPLRIPQIFKDGLRRIYTNNPA